MHTCILNAFEFIELSASMIISAFEIQPEATIISVNSNPNSPSIRLSVMWVLAENRSFEVVTGYGRRIRIVFDILMIHQPSAISRYPFSMQSTRMRVLCKYSRDCKPRSNTGYDNTSTKHRVYRCIIAGTYTRTYRGCVSQESDRGTISPTLVHSYLYIHIYKLHVINAYSKSFLYIY